jgi:hypothetical protein
VAGARIVVQESRIVVEQRHGAPRSQRREQKLKNMRKTTGGKLAAAPASQPPPTAKNLNAAAHAGTLKVAARLANNRRI